MTKIHCIVAIDPDTGKEYIFRPHQIEHGLKLLESVEEIIGHHIIGFDIKAIQKLYPNWKPKGVIRDTLVMTRLHRPDLSDIDRKAILFSKFPPHLRNSHSLEAWGWRIGGNKKSEFGKTADWSTFTEQMLAYCVQDVRVNVDLWHFIQRQKLNPVAVEIENDVACIMQRQEDNGLGFNIEAARELQAELMNREAHLTAELRKHFQPWYAPGKVHTTKTTRRAKMPEYPDVRMPRISEKTGKRMKDYVGPPLNTFEAGTEYTPIKMTEFNPSSRDHVADRLQRIYGWKPKAHGADGKPSVDESVLERLPSSWPVKPLLLEYFVVAKTLGMLGQGAQSWLRNVRDTTGRIHGRVITNGAVTGRATHRNPNLAQVPKVRLSPSKEVLKGYAGRWGWECRSLFVPQKGWTMVGCDCSGLELRLLAHYLARIDGGAYTKIVLEGDPHEFHRTLAGLSTRDIAKTWIYAFIYGAGKWLLGHIANPEADDATQERIGGKIRARFLKNFPELEALKEAVMAALASKGYIVGLDGRRIYARSANAALNALLQSAGAIVCKQWIREFHKAMNDLGYVEGVDYRHMAWVHDEIQIECRPELGEIIGREAVEATKRAGEFFGLRCPTGGEFKIGQSWAETH